MVRHRKPRPDIYSPPKPDIAKGIPLVRTFRNTGSVTLKYIPAGIVLRLVEYERDGWKIELEAGRLGSGRIHESFNDSQSAHQAYESISRAIESGLYVLEVYGDGRLGLKLT